jgi:hypothetical protein
MALGEVFFSFYDVFFLLRVPTGLLFRWPLQLTGGFDWNVSLVFSTFYTAFLTNNFTSVS